VAHHELLKIRIVNFYRLHAKLEGGKERGSSRNGYRSGQAKKKGVACGRELKERGGPTEVAETRGVSHL